MASLAGQANKYELVFLALVILSAAYLRFSSLDWEDFSWNEGTHFGASLEYAKGNFVYNFNDYATPPLLKYFGAAAYAFFGFSEILLRSVVALFGLATIFALYFFAKKNYGVRTGLFASAVLSFSIVHLAFSRMFLTEAVVGFFLVLTLFFYSKMLRVPSAKNVVLFGVSLGLAMLTKYLSLYIVAGLLVHAVWTGIIRIQVRKKFSVSAENYFLRGFIVAVITFFLLWPFSLYPISIHFDAQVVGHEGKGDAFTVAVPGFVISPGEYLTAALGREEILGYVQESGIQENIITIPILGYLFVLGSKESLIFLPLLLLGLYAMFRRRNSTDNILLVFFFVFLLLLWNQKYGWSYRYLTPLMPVIALICARSADLVRKERAKGAFILAASAILFASAFLAHPDYMLHYNALDSASDFKPLDSEIVMLYGYREGTAFARDNCLRVAGELARSVVKPDEDPAGRVLTSPTQQDLPFCAYVFFNSTYPRQLEKELGAKCDVIKEIEIDGLRLRQIHMCYAGTA